MRLLLALALAGASGGVLRERLAASSHGTFGRHASLEILRSRRAVSRVSCQRFLGASNKRSVIRACMALRDPRAYTILQIRGYDDTASLYVIKQTKPGAHTIVSILSTGGGTPLSSLREATDWHSKNFPNISIALSV